MEKKKIWTGRINKQTNALAEEFIKSIKIDKELYVQDLIGNAAYAVGLESIGILSRDELKLILIGLKEIKKAIEENKVDFNQYEDIHSLVEFELEKNIGTPASKIHTGRSRNDQIVLDELLYIKSAIAKIVKLILDLEDLLIEKASKNLTLILPAYTHMQKAQPVLVSHYLLAYFEKFSRCLRMLFFNFQSSDFLPLGAGACVGSGYPINRQLLASILKFEKLGSNSMDIVSSRDCISDYLYTCTMIMQNLSRFAEDFIIFNSQEFSYINIDDSFCTGSSIMPQKKNPDILELIRGKSAAVLGHLMQIMALLKGLPLTYNSDLQEDKKILFNAHNETTNSISIFIELLKNTEFDKNKMLENCKGGFIEATDAADYLVKKGLAFRQAHSIVGSMVNYCIKKGIHFYDLDLNTLKKFSEFFDNDFFENIKIENCINSKLTDCSTSTQSVRNNIEKAKEEILSFKKEYNSLINKIPDFDEIIKTHL